MPKEKRKHQYVVGLDYSEEKQARLKKLLGVLGYKSARVFIVEAIDEKLERGLKKIAPEARAVLERIIET